MANNFEADPIIKSILADGTIKAVMCACGKKAVYMVAMPLAENLTVYSAKFNEYKLKGHTIKIVNKIDFCSTQATCISIMPKTPIVSQPSKAQPLVKKLDNGQQSLF